jgi:hypothetical protein
VLAVNTVAPFVLTAIMRKSRRLIYPTRWTRRLRRRPPRRRRSLRGAVSSPASTCTGAERRCTGSCRTDRPDLDPPDRPGKVLDLLELPSTEPPRATRRWTSARSSRSCSAPDLDTKAWFIASTSGGRVHAGMIRGRSRRSRI